MHASHEALTLHSPVAHPGSPWLTLAHPACEVGVLKRYGVGEPEARGRFYFFSFLLPRHRGAWKPAGAKQIKQIQPHQNISQYSLLFCCLNDYVRLAYVYWLRSPKVSLPWLPQKVSATSERQPERQPDQALSFMRIPHFDCFFFRILTFGIYSSLNSQSSPL